jgi:N-acetylglucosamine malate deacetylase 1
MKLDILALAAHPDDIELSCSGTLVAHIKAGKKVGIIDFTQGELGTRGTVDTRREEALESSKILGLSVRENLGFSDGFFANDRIHQLSLIRVIRKYQPEIVIANAIHDRHIDHGRGAQLANDACFLAGLAKIETKDDDGVPQKEWRPKALYHYIQDRFIHPQLVVDISPYWDIKLASILAFKTQFFNPDSNEPSTPISSRDFLEFLEGRAREYGRMIGVTYGEGFTKATPIGTSNLFDLI